MTLDKFGRHISKRFKADTTALEQKIVKNVEKQIIEKFGGDVKFVEEGVEKLFHNRIENVEDSIRKLNKRIGNNSDSLENIAKKFKGNEDTNIIDYNEKISNLNIVTEENSELIKKIEKNSNIMGENYNQIREFEKEIINDILAIKAKINDTSVIDNAKREVTNEMTSKFQKFTNMLHERVSTEVTNFAKQHENRDKRLEEIVKSTTLHNLVHKNDSNKISLLDNQIKGIENKIYENNIDVNNTIENVRNQFNTFEEKLLQSINEAVGKIDVKIRDLYEKNSEKIDNYKLNIDNITNTFEDLKKNVKDITLDVKKIETKVEELKTTLENKITNVSLDINDVEKLYKELKYNVSDNKSTLKNLEDKLSKELKTLNELVQKTAEVSRKEFNNTMAYARTELNETINEINIRVDGVVENTKDMILAVDNKILSKINELENTINSRLKELENKHN
jgi:chromosome segregation ATPase